MSNNKIIILGGATASGKSSLALKWAKEQGGEIINADSMQIYRELDILTACPNTDELNAVPHHLYRYLKGDDPCSAERWRDLARGVIDDVHCRGRVPIIVGGTGLYLKALVNGLSKVPEIDPVIRKQVRAEVNEFGAEASHNKLLKIDPEMASRLAPNDSQRIARALEVVLSTGRSLAAWQQEPEFGGLADEEFQIEKFVIERDRADLYARCDLRFKKMIEEGQAIEEVKRLLLLGYDANLPVMKSLGVPQLIDFIAGKSTREQAVTLAQTATRQFAKRQMTWFRNQFSDWEKHNL
ncbi:MAG: tRNA (adenosine(37)-N6)-dimethylallyltransferase MiaA [Kordiimonadaceae bacterium]|nr:tRNA (adenosine(37)-N6)-dimethylallyltransferase MiaA [Kordiimonadaceae bacterium]